MRLKYLPFTLCYILYYHYNNNMCNLNEPLLEAYTGPVITSIVKVAQ